MSAPEEPAARAREGVLFEEGRTRITEGELFLGAEREPISLDEILDAEETSTPTSAKQIGAGILGCVLLLCAVPATFMCPLALGVIPWAAKLFSFAVRESETSFSLRIRVRGRRPVVVRFEERAPGLRVEQALNKALDERAHAARRRA